VLFFKLNFLTPQSLFIILSFIIPQTLPQLSLGFVKISRGMLEALPEQTAAI